VIIGYHGGGVWGIGPNRDEWKLATRETHHSIHHNMEYDTINKKIAVFGEYQSINEIWLYTSAIASGSPGTWEKRIPQGDSLPKSQSFPMAFDEVRGVFLLVVDNPRNGSNRPAGALSSSTYTYDLKTNAYYHLPSGNMPPMGMNYMMVYDKKHAVSLLITGDWQHATTVWALETIVRTLKLCNN
jgi:hypothetical protein